MRPELFSYAIEFGIGLTFSSAHPLAMSLAIFMPAIAYRQRMRAAAYYAAICYYAGALWPLVPGARNFFGSTPSLPAALVLWAAACLLLASPWALVWSPEQTKAWWRCLCGLVLGVVPPLGLIGWASPLEVAGFLFPGTCWWGLAGCAAAPALICTHRRVASLFIAATSILCNATTRALPTPPPNWVAINTHFGPIAHG